MRVAWAIGASLAVGALGVASGCDHGSAAPEQEAGPPIDPTTLYDPAVCRTCHADHFNQWSGSMHAYSSQDPVFLAMNARGQRETDGGLGPFCVKCHAPMALMAGKTTNGLNLPELNAACSNPPNGVPTGCGFLGVTCYFCHSIDSVDTAHAFNAAVTLASDGVMRGEVTNPVPIGVHGAKYSPYHDNQRAESAAMCGACHDIHAPPGGHIERTFQEWQTSPFSGLDAGPEAGVTTCAQAGCHMTADPGVPIAAVPGKAPFPSRTLYEHDFPAVDQAQKAPTPFPNAQEEQQAVVQNLANGLQGALCVTPPGLVSVVLDTVGIGHDFPSGSAQDRRLWVEVIAYDQASNVIYQSGVVPDGMSPVDVGKSDPDMWLMRDCMFGTDGRLVDMFWQGATPDPNELPPIAAFYPSGLVSHSHKFRSFPKDQGAITTDAGAPLMPTSVTLRLRLQPIGIDVLNDLVDSGDLDAGLIAALPPPIDIPLGAGASNTLTWTAEAAMEAGAPAPFGNTTCVGTLAVPAARYAAPTHTNPLCSP
jgi:hypothetical protein